MKEDILKLRNEGKTYNEIQEILGCSKGTISYHCGEGQKEKTNKRSAKQRTNIILSKVGGFKYRKKTSNIVKKDLKDKKDVNESIRKFQKRDNLSNGRVNKEIELTFTWEDVLKKFGENTVCYLSGEEINLYKNTYHFDHIIPSSKGGNNEFENLGIAHSVVNKMKSDLTPDELIKWCVKILKHNGYNVSKNTE